MNAPRHPGVEPRKEERVYSRHLRPRRTCFILPRERTFNQSTKTIIEKTKIVIVTASRRIVGKLI
jgi:hypothetical protein